MSSLLQTELSLRPPKKIHNSFCSRGTQLILRQQCAEWGLQLKIEVASLEGMAVSECPWPDHQRERDRTPFTPFAPWNLNHYSLQYIFIYFHWKRSKFSIFMFSPLDFLYVSILFHVETIQRLVFVTRWQNQADFRDFRGGSRMRWAFRTTSIGRNHRIGGSHFSNHINLHFGDIFVGKSLLFDGFSL